jgi:AraC family transcriptional regulator
LIFHSPEEVHSDQFHARTRCLSLEIDVAVINDKGLHSARIEKNAGFHSSLLKALITRLYYEFRNMDDLSPLVMEGLLLELIGEASREPSKTSKAGPRWLEQTREFLHHQFPEVMPLTEIAKSVGIHHTHLAREFRRHYRCTVGDYIRQLRVEFARIELSRSDKPLSEIALAAGFVDQSHFSRVFKIQTGLSPGRYRAVFRPR